ncbi:MAG: dienelactone hydrolase family protein [Pseudomonadota bacterium]|nr:dienelactone hydrolase family protein [Pseudomonadota bacterium]
MRDSVLKKFIFPVSFTLVVIFMAALSSCVIPPFSTTINAEEQELAATMKEHGNDLPIPSPLTKYKPAQPVVSESVVYTTTEGQEVQGWLARPEGTTDALPGLIVIHEWWGLNDNVRRAAERLAGEGYVALAVDLHKGKTADTPKDAMMMGRVLSNNQEPALANLTDAHAFLKAKANATNIGIIGWCQGGRWSMAATLNMPEKIAATVVYYGRVPEDRAEVAVIQSPVLGVFAGEDFIVPPKIAYKFAVAMEDEKKDLEFYMYRDAAHAFSNPSGIDYNEAAAADAWKHTTAFLARNLK